MDKCLWGSNTNAENFNDHIYIYISVVGIVMGLKLFKKSCSLYPKEAEDELVIVFVYAASVSEHNGRPPAWRWNETKRWTDERTYNHDDDQDDDEGEDLWPKTFLSFSKYSCRIHEQTSE